MNAACDPTEWLDKTYSQFTLPVNVARVTGRRRSSLRTSRWTERHSVRDALCLAT